MDELRECPFCGSKDVEPKTSYAVKKSGLTMMLCYGCGATVSFQGKEQQRIAISAWDNRHSPKPEALTLEQLREMDGEPVWVVPLLPLVSRFNPHYEVIEMVCDDLLYISGRGPREFRTYGTTWLAYTTKPETEGTRQCIT